MNATVIPGSGTSSDKLPPPKPSALRLVFRIFRWTTYAAAIVTLLMVFHAAPNTTPAGDGNANLPTPSGTPAEQVEQVRSSVRDVKVELFEDRVRAYVVFDFHGKNLTLQ